MASPRNQKAAAPPDGQLRRSQVITTFGPGSMVDLVDQAVVIGGLDFWSFDPAQLLAPINEPRLRDALAERMRAAGRELSTEAPFREPPAADDRDPTRHRGIQALEFPQWFVCQNPDCRALVRSDALVQKRNRYQHDCDGRKPTECVPIRFVAACKRGHLQEFPWLHFLHEAQETKRCPAPQLRLREGATGDFAEIRVTCSCGVERPLSNATLADANPRCLGDRPWLGVEGQELACDQRIRLLVRTASNSYFAQVVSALTVPEPGRELRNAVTAEWAVLKAATAATLPAFRTIPKVKAAIAGYDDADVLAVVDALNAGAPAHAAPLRTAEFQQFTAAKAESPGDLPEADDDFFVRTTRPSGGLPAGIGRLVLAHKLREVRAQVGFTRIEAATPTLQGEYDLGVQSAMLGLTTTWLPATEIRGEGVFFTLDEVAVREWEGRRAVVDRAHALEVGYDRWASELEGPPPFLGARFYLLHSLSHLLISAISLTCGYAASAIRERIYCDAADAETPMAAILLSTGTPGTEGTLGGLVEQGRKLGSHLRRAWDLGILCSNDPVCGAHDPNGDPSERYLEGCACHGCLFIAECSCERFNRYLDRALVVPTIGRDADTAFFRQRP